MQRDGPVSYTHLDVYKRQGRRYPGWEPAWEGPFSIAATLGGQIYTVEKDGRPYKVHRKRLKPAGEE